MSFFAKRLSYAKINLYLKVKGVRKDSYHDIDTIFQEIDLADELSFKISKDGLSEINVVCPAVSGPMSQNLIYKAVQMFLDCFGGSFSVDIDVKKNIPLGSGLGGGSSNVALTLSVLGEFCGVSRDDLLPLAKRLGADVPFFLYGGLASGTGRGDEITCIDFQYKKNFLIVVPPVCVSTQKIFDSFRLKSDAEKKKRLTEVDFYDKSLEYFVERITIKRQFLLGNDLEGVACSEYDLLAKIKKTFLDSTFLRPFQITGSGASFFLECPSKTYIIDAVLSLFRRLGCRCFVSGAIFRSNLKT